MKVIKGKLAGDGYKLHQFANDWITADDPHGRPMTLKPDAIQIAGKEFEVMCESYRRYLEGSRKEGYFWDAWELRPDGTLRRKASQAEIRRQVMERIRLKEERRASDD